MGCGTESVEWIGQEFCGIDLGDKRLDRRLVKAATMLARNGNYIPDSLARKG